MAIFTRPDGKRITWVEIVDEPCSPRLRFESDRTSAVRVIECAWGDYFDLAQGIIGDSYVGDGDPFTGPGGPNPGYKFVSRFLPWGFPFLNSYYKRYLWASSVEVEGRGVPLDNNQIGGVGNDAVSLYKNARLTVQFDTRMYDIMDDATLKGQTSGTMDEGSLLRYVTKIYRPQGESLVLSGTAYFYSGVHPPGGGPALPLSKDIAKILVSYNLSLTWHGIPEDGVPSGFLNASQPNLAIDNCLGRVNDDTFHGCRQGTLLLIGAELKPQVSAFGNRTYDITYMFKFFNPAKLENIPNGNIPGHNHIFRPFGVDPGWYEVTTSQADASAAKTNFLVKLDNRNIYNFANFKMLFRPAAWRG